MDSRLAALSSALDLQRGAFSRAQALESGFSDDAIAAQLAARRWQRAFPGVFAAFTGPLPDQTRLWAALLWAGKGAALCDVTALGQYGVQGLPADIRCACHRRPHPQGGAPPGIVLHRRRRLESFVHPVRVPRHGETGGRSPASGGGAGWLNRLADGLSLLADVCQQRHTSPRRLRDALALLPKLRSRKTFWAVLDDVVAGAQTFPRDQLPQQGRARSSTCPRLDGRPPA